MENAGQAVATDPNQMQSMLAAIQSARGAGPDAPQAAAPAAEPEPAPAAVAAPAAEPAAPVQQQPAGILAKDGKNILPFDVLQQARSQITDLQAKIQEMQAATQQAQNGQLPDMPDISKLEGEYPAELLAPLKAMQQTLMTLNNSNQQLQQDLQARQQERDQAQNDAKAIQYQQAVEQAPLLKQLETVKGPWYDHAKAVSDQMLKDPSYANKNDPAAHFKDVESRVKQDFQASNALFNPAPAPSPNPVPAQPAAAAKPLPPLVAPAPASLSDISGGTPPATSEAEGYLKMNDIDRISMLMGAAKKGAGELGKLMQRTYR